MILTGDEVRQLLAGKRTALILPPTSRPAYEVGRSYAVKRKGGSDPVARVLVIAVTAVDLHEVDYATMRKAGFKYREDLHQHWLDEFKVNSGPTDAPLPTPALVVRFHVDRASSRRYLRPGPRGGYVEAPDDKTPRGIMMDEPECVPEAWQDRFSQEARVRDLDEARERRERPITTPLPVRLAAAMRTAERGRVDISRQLGIIAKRVEAIERTVEDEAA